MSGRYPERNEYFSAFIRTAQYITRLTPKQDILTETGNAVVRFYGAGIVGFFERMRGGGLTGHHWVNPGEIPQELFATAEVRSAITEVLETGFLATHPIGPEGFPATFLPITWENGITAVMLVAHRTKEPVPDELLDSYLAVAGLVSTAVASAVVAFTTAAEKKQAEDALREAQENLAFLVKNTPAMLYRSHASGDPVTTFISENVRTQLGYEPGELTADPAFFISRVHPDDREGLRRSVAGALATGDAIAEYRFLGSDGTWRWMHDEMRLVPNGDNRPAELLGYRIDISRRKEAEEELFRKNEELNEMNEELTAIQEHLREANDELRSNEMDLSRKNEELTVSEQRYRDLAESGRLLLSSDTPEVIVQAICERVMIRLDCDAFFNYLIDDTGTRMFLNAYAGTPERTAQEIGWLDLGVAVCGCVARAGERILVEDVQNSSDERTSLIRSLGMTAYACHPLVYQDRPIGTLSFGTRGRARFTDEEVGMMKAVTDLVAMAMARKRSETALTEYMNRLRESNRELERFAYVASHDLKEPLRAVTGFAQLFERKYGGRIDSVADEYIRYIVDGGIRMDALVNDLLDYSRVNSADGAFEPVDLNEVVRTVTTDLRERIREAGVEIEIAELPLVNADRMQMIRLFQNLVSNAIKFGRGDDPAIRIDFTDRDGVYEFFVRDNGIGIGDEHFERIFEIFQRLHTQDEYPGTGIGLAICRKIVERHGGRIRVESEEGAGSTFYFTIPRPS